MMSYMDAALMTSDIFISGIRGSVAVLYPAYMSSNSTLAPMKSAEGSLF
jgi:hypothetical protein